MRRPGSPSAFFDFKILYKIYEFDVMMAFRLSVKGG